MTKPKSVMFTEVLQKQLFESIVKAFVEKLAQDLINAVDYKGFRGMVFGASGGIDSLVTAYLCVRAQEIRDKYQVVAFQMNDLRVKGENYNTDIYKDLGADLIQKDITAEAVDIERRLGMPPRWLTICLMKFILRWVPMRARRRVILFVKANDAPEWVLIHYRLLTLLHRLRITRIKEYATRHKLMLVICANLTETSLGYFVEHGIDDPFMGDYVPLSGLYKTQVIRLGQFMGLQDKVIYQKPSPGFGGIYDEEIIGPYELVDLILIGLKLGYSDAEIAEAISPFACKWIEKSNIRRKGLYDIRYVRFIRQLRKLNARKGNF